MSKGEYISTPFPPSTPGSPWNAFRGGFRLIWVLRSQSRHIFFLSFFMGEGGSWDHSGRMYSLSDSNGVLKKTVKYSKNNFVFFLSTEKNRIHDERESKIISKQVRSRSQKYIPRPQHWGWAKNGKEGCTPSLPSHLINYICNE